MIARRMFLREWWAIDIARAGGSSKFSRFAILHRMLDTSDSWGAGTRIWRQRDLNGKITLLKDSQLAMILQLGMKVSIVRLREACADCDN